MRARADPGSLQTAAQSTRAAALFLVFLASACSREVLYHPGGVKRSEGCRLWIGHVEDGFWTYWYPNGSLREQGRYVRSRREGIWEQWYPNGLSRSRGRRVWNEAAGRSDREGAWTFWHDNGVRHSVGVFRAGLREGHWDYNHVDGSLDGDRTGEYHDDVLIR